MSGPLSGIRIIDVSERSPAAAIASMMLCDYGAEVIKVEAKSGDPLRALDACQVWLRGHKSVTLDSTASTDGRWENLRSTADVVIDTIHSPAPKPSPLLSDPHRYPGQVSAFITALPCSADEILQASAALNSPFPAAYGELLEAHFGFLHVQDGYREAPIFLGWPHAAYGAAWLIQLGILAALYEREKTGQGQCVTTSLLDGMAILNVNRWCTGAGLGKDDYGHSAIARRGNVRSIVAPFQCSDKKWMYVHTGPRGAFERLMHLVGRDDISAHKGKQELGGLMLPPDVADDMWDHLTKTYATKPANYWVELHNSNDIASMPILETGEVLGLEQMKANGIAVATADGRRQFGLAAKFSRTPGSVASEFPAPGQHSAELLKEQGQKKAAAAAPKAGASVNGRSPKGPLDGLLVLDFGNFLAAPFGARLLSDLGARVVKVEELEGQHSRTGAPRIYLPLERGKESCPLDLKSEDGMAKFRRIAARADVIVHNMRLDAARRLGTDYESIRKINPEVVYCHGSGYGNDGPWAKLPAFGVLQTAISGLMTRAAGRGNPPTNILASLDWAAGCVIAVSTLAAVVEKARSGKGQHVEVVQAATGPLGNSDIYFDGEKKSDSFELDQQQLGFAPTNALYRTRDGWILLACYQDQEWRAVPAALGIPSASWPTYAEARKHKVEDSPVGRQISEKLAGMSAADAYQHLTAAGIPSVIPAPMLPKDATDNQALTRLGTVVEEEHPQYGPIREVGLTVRFEGNREIKKMPAPVLGQYAERVLKELAV
jgi:crotonobetainyl-CoA:carnitine CoA-transferase CaiB-like acyl-CoA transferase